MANLHLSLPECNPNEFDFGLHPIRLGVDVDLELGAVVFNIDWNGENRQILLALADSIEFVARLINAMSELRDHEEKELDG